MKRYSYAWQHVKESHDMRALHVIASNRILQMAIAGKPQEECEKALKEYKNLIPIDTIKNQLEFANCATAYYRQIGDEKKVEKLIRETFKQMIDEVDDDIQREIFISSNFRMLMNGHYNHEWFDCYVKSGYQNYRNLPIPEKTAVFKEYMGIFGQEEFRSVCNKEPYKTLKQTIMNYYQTDAIQEIDEKLEKNESYNVHLYHTLMCNKLAILKVVEGKSHIDQSKEIYLNLYRELYDKGLHIDAINTLMILVEECKSPYNVKVWNPFFFGAMYYSDLLEMLPPTPDPVLAEDGIHLNYYRVNVPPQTQIVPTKEDVIKEYIDVIIHEFNSWKNHPFKLNLSIQIAHVLMCLDRWDEAKEFYNYFLDSGVSPRQFASWVVEDIQVLGLEFQDEAAE